MTKILLLKHWNVGPLKWLEKICTQKLKDTDVQKNQEKYDVCTYSCDRLIWPA